MANITSTSNAFGGREATTGARIAINLGGTIYVGAAQSVDSSGITQSDFLGDQNIGDPIEMVSSLGVSDFDSTAWATGATAYSAATTVAGRQAAVAGMLDSLAENKFIWLD